MFFQAEVGEVVILARKVVKNGNWTFTVAIGTYIGFMKKKTVKFIKEQQDFKLFQASISDLKIILYILDR